MREVKVGDYNGKGYQYLPPIVIKIIVAFSKPRPPSVFLHCLIPPLLIVIV